MDYTLNQKGNIQILKINNLLSEIQNKKILQQATQQIEQGFSNFVVDLSKMDFINSVGISFLLNLMKRSTKSGGKIVLVNPNSTIQNILKVTKINQFFPTKNNIEEATDLVSNK